MSFHIFNRRVHLYSALFLLLFFLRFSLSSISLNHASWFERMYEGQPEWQERFQRSYTFEVPSGSDVRAVGGRILADLGLEGPYGAYQAGENTIAVHRDDFWTTIRVTYHISQQRVVVEDKAFRLHHWLMRFHWISGYQQDSFASDLWAFMTDVVCVALIVWVLTGCYLWWKIRVTRLWGTVALGSGVVSFVILLLYL